MLTWSRVRYAKILYAFFSSYENGPNVKNVLSVALTMIFSLPVGYFADVQSDEGRSGSGVYLVWNFEEAIADAVGLFEDRGFTSRQFIG